jgi:hypothetical protein
VKNNIGIGTNQAGTGGKQMDTMVTAVMMANVFQNVGFIQNMEELRMKL